MATSERASGKPAVAHLASRADDSFFDSLWSATAGAGQHHAPLIGRKTAQLAVVGAGYTGLSAAIEAARRGLDVVVLDAQEPGFGASGRNGGQVIPLLKYAPDEIIARYGEKIGAGMLDVVRESAEAVFGYIDQFGIECEATRGGWIQAAHSDAAAPGLRQRYRQMQAHGADVAWLDATGVAAAIGTGYYPAGWVLRRGGTVQPLSYARGLARAAVSLGASVHGSSPARALERAGAGWLLKTDRGEIHADKVLLATNAYTEGLWPGLRQSIVPLYSMQVATDPLSGDAARSLLPNGHSVSDTRRIVRYFRKDRDGRFVIGTRGPFTSRPSAGHAKALIRSARQMFPVLEKIPFTYRWAGPVAVTTDGVPHLHNPAPGLWAALGYNGRGVAMATMLGRIAAAACDAKAPGIPGYPTTDVSAIPLHVFHRLGVHAVVTYYRLLDQLA